MLTGQILNLLLINQYIYVKYKLDDKDEYNQTYVIINGKLIENNICDHVHIKLTYFIKKNSSETL